MDPQSRYRETTTGSVGRPWEQITYGDEQQSASEKILRSRTIHNGSY